MRVLASSILACCLVFGRVGTAAAADPQWTPGSTAFCLYELTAETASKRRWINLGIVQYIEASASEVKIYYGGGGFGSGHDARIPVASLDEALAVLERIRKAAASCR